jgi:hypothetical protein
MICLGLAISSMGRAMQRQSDNRHHLIAQVKRLNLKIIFKLSLDNGGDIIGDGIPYSIPGTPPVGRDRIGRS